MTIYTIIPFSQNSALTFQHSRFSQNTLKTVTHFQQFRPTTSKTRHSSADITTSGCYTTDISVAHESELLRKVESLLLSMDYADPDECSEIYALILQKCRKLGHSDLGFQVHAHLITCGVEIQLREFLGSQLLELYCKNGHVKYARKLFDKIPERNIFSFTSMMEMYHRLGRHRETIGVYYAMIDGGIRPDNLIFPKVFKACSELRDYKSGKDVLDHMSRIGFEGNSHVKRSVLEMLVKCGKMNTARKLFEGIRFKDVVMWNIMVSGYANRGEFLRAKRYIDAMKLDGLMPDCVTWSSLLSGYIQNGKFKQAFEYLEEQSYVDDFRPNVITWTTVIAGCEKKGRSTEALSLFCKMVKRGVRPNQVTISSVVSCCTNLSLSRHGKEVHGYCVKRGELGLDPLVNNSLISFYSKLSSLKSAVRIFEGIERKDLVSWNSMLSGYALGGYRDEAMELHDEMERLGLGTDVVTWNGLVTGFTRNGDGKTCLEFLRRMLESGEEQPDSTTLSSALSACAQTKELRLGKEIHGFLTRHGIELSTGIGSALVSMYSSCESMEFAYSVFGEIPEKDVIVWNSIIAGCSRAGFGVTGLNLLREMNLEVGPDSVTIISALKACSRLAALRQGREIHAFVIRRGLDQNGNFVRNALVDMYGRCGSIRESRRVFDSNPTGEDLVAWNVMISMYGMHGFGTEAVGLFQKMTQLGLKPNRVTFTNLLSACTHSGLVNEGLKHFESMETEHELKPDIEQHACVIDLLSRAGNFNQALEFIEKMPFEPNAAIWGSLLGGCRVHSNLEMAEFAAKRLFELEPRCSGNYIIMANIYSGARRFDKAAEVRALMRERKVAKLSPGCSWIEVRREVHSFVAGDESHPAMREVRAKVEGLYKEIKKMGFEPRTRFVLRGDVAEELKETSLCGHSEKLALGFGLISTEANQSLRIIKNLRICGDCHEAVKYISELEGREIVMRDNYRFHHFYQGVCSCGDYW